MKAALIMVLIGSFFYAIGKIVIIETGNELLGITVMVTAILITAVIGGAFVRNEETESNDTEALPDPATTPAPTTTTNSRNRKGCDKRPFVPR